MAKNPFELGFGDVVYLGFTGEDFLAQVVARWEKKELFTEYLNRLGGYSFGSILSFFVGGRPAG
ncbi:MAG TPA: hypothetical protein GX687_01125 [Clostridia bacterium]|nr:hypothetical protein [Clostridia bacterium]